MYPSQSDFHFSPHQKHYSGKVRDVYRIGDILISIASDRISAFDHILPKSIPHKGQVLNQLAAYFLEATKDIVPNWLEATPDPNVSIGKACDPIKLEMVIRGYLTGHAWRTYRSGKRVLCGVALPEGMVENQRFEKPIITPATKAEEGHDEDISKEKILERKIVSEEIYHQLEHYTHTLFAKGQEMAVRRGLILVDTKYEFGIYENEILLIDEIHTPDSSRYFYAEGYQERQDKKQAQEQLSKEFVREWLMEHGFQGQDGQQMPEMSSNFVNEVSQKYIHLYELLTGEDFIKADYHDAHARIEQNVKKYLQSN